MNFRQAVTAYTGCGAFVVFILCLVGAAMIETMIAPTRLTEATGLALGVTAYIPILIAVHLWIRKKVRAVILRQRQERSNEAARTLTLDLIDCHNSSINLPNEMAESLSIANVCSSHAIAEYRESAFDPYWTAIEQAANSLGRYRDALAALSANSQDYNAKLAGHSHTFPIFPIQIESLPKSDAVLEKYNQALRLGQTNPDFALIWEQRRTRAAIAAGFNSLGEAVSNVAIVVQRELAALEDSLQSSTARIVEQQVSTRESMEELADKRFEVLDEIRRNSRPSK